MNTLARILGLLLAFSGPAVALAQDADHAARQGPEQAQTVTQSSSLESQLEEARKRLDAAAQELASLHKRLYTGGHGEKAMLGVLVDMDNGATGVQIKGVTPKSGAAIAGLQAKDILVAINGARLDLAGENGLELLSREMGTVTPGDTVQVEYLRAGTANVVDVVTHAQAGHVVEIVKEHLGDHDMTGTHDMATLVGGGGLVGLNLVEMDEDLAHYFNGARGVLVAKAPKDSGLKSGDVLLEIGDEKITDARRARRALFAGNDAPLSAVVRRRGKDEVVDINANVLTMGDTSGVKIVRIKKLCGDDDCKETDVELVIDDSSTQGGP